MNACLVAIEEMLPQGRVTVAFVRIGIGGLATAGIAMPSSIASIEGHLLLGGALRFFFVSILLPLFPALVNVRAHRFTRRRQTRGTVREQSKDHQGGKKFHDAPQSRTSVQRLASRTHPLRAIQGAHVLGSIVVRTVPCALRAA